MGRVQMLTEAARAIADQLLEAAIWRAAYDLLTEEPEYRMVKPAELRIGDVIREGEKLKRRIPVEKLSACPGYPGHVHVNRSSCYDRIATIYVE